MLQVKVHQMFLSNLGFVVVLKGDKDDRSLPIFIGAAEAQAIALVMNGVEAPRPMTHDLIKNLLDLIECRLVRIAISDINDGTFYAKLFVDYDGVQMDVDSRPSDAIALAMRYKCPIYVANHVMDEAGKVLDEDHIQQAQQKEEAKVTQPARKALSGLDLLKDNLDTAIKEERYEEAADLRDKIRDWSKNHTAN
jgi:uncharacterized protein